MNKKVEFQHLGLIPYQQAWEMQEDLLKKVVEIKRQNRQQVEKKPTPNYLLFCQHPHVYTLGKSGSLKNLLISESEMKEKGIAYFAINRGGDITYHGQGQLVGYPILDLDNFFQDLHKYMRFIEEAVIRLLADYGIAAGRYAGYTGVWIEPEIEERARKICAIGIRATQWVTMHGFAFNVNTDLNYFKNIIPCGIEDKAVTSLAAELGREIELASVEARLKHHLAEVFEMELI
ncbi:lipoyl(octanoyl) transferase LipB [Hugenholtzia roseola]|uniref:lipoyl(octanoyl) transferase LipB n=1 Tax=Hugenholtzia roseola TaxID=1002 RepID=UPI000419DA5D|nr:lipoyl(octanoyl) transferase LipB [Hugenholtzia roseola]